MRNLKAILISGLLVLGLAMHAQAGIQEIRASTYTSNGPSIVGWNWLRSSGHYAEWTFEIPQGVDIRKACICLSSLSTNQAGGGAGFDSKLNVLRGGGSNDLELVNDCPCLQYSDNSNGIGYRSRGCLRTKIDPDESVHTLRVSYPGGNHTAVKKGSVKLIIVIR